MSGVGLPTDLILPALRDTFGEWASWQRPDTGDAVAIKGRFRIDPAEAALGATLAPGFNAVQTWFYCARADVPSPDRAPGLHDYLLIRNEWFEIVQLDADDLGELGYRLLKASNRDADPTTPWPGQTGVTRRT